MNKQPESIKINHETQLVLTEGSQALLREAGIEDPTVQSELAMDFADAARFALARAARQRDVQDAVIAHPEREVSFG